MIGIVDRFEDEIPTRPDNPSVARRCIHCGKVYGEHAQTIQPQSPAPCRGIRKLFEPELTSNGEDR